MKTREEIYEELHNIKLLSIVAQVGKKQDLIIELLLEIRDEVEIIE